MRILKIELKNFGRFLDHTLEFHDGLNILCAKNGAGKSTIHTFLGAMKELRETDNRLDTLDDPFAAYDQERLKAVLRWLKRSGHQVILFTSRSMEQGKKKD